MLDKLKSLEREALAALEVISTHNDLLTWTSQYLGRKGQITMMLRSAGQLPQEDRPAFGKLANQYLWFCGPGVARASDNNPMRQRSQLSYNP